MENLEISIEREILNACGIGAGAIDLAKRVYELRKEDSNIRDISFSKSGLSQYSNSPFLITNVELKSPFKDESEFKNYLKDHNFPNGESEVHITQEKPLEIGFGVNPLSSDAFYANFYKSNGKAHMNYCSYKSNVEHDLLKKLGVGDDALSLAKYIRDLKNDDSNVESISFSRDTIETHRDSFFLIANIKLKEPFKNRSDFKDYLRAHNLPNGNNRIAVNREDPLDIGFSVKPYLPDAFYAHFY